jgi:hypothetical protein
MLSRNMRDPFLDYVTNNDMIRSYLETYYHTALLKNERGETDVQIAARLGYDELHRLLLRYYKE